MSPERHIVLFILSFFVISLPVSAQQPQKYISVISENDIYVPKGQDRHYTNGLRLGFGMDKTNEGAWYKIIDRFIGVGTNTGVRPYEIAIGHNIYNPEFFISPEPQINDRPYAGWLYGELSTTVHDAGVEIGLNINLGVVGPAAFAEDIQKFNHSIIGDSEPRGWDNQLKNEPALLVRYRRSGFTSLVDGEQINVDLITRFGVNLGNVFTDAGAGLVLRLGNHLPQRELPLRIQPGLSGNSSQVPVRKGRFDWQIYAEAQGRGIARNIFLDGNTFRDSQSVNKRPFVWDAGTGLVLGFGQFRHPVFMSFTFIWRGREFDGQRGIDSFGSAQIGMYY